MLSRRQRDQLADIAAAQRARRAVGREAVQQQAEVDAFTARLTATPRDPAVNLHQAAFNAWATSSYDAGPVIDAAHVRSMIRGLKADRFIDDDVWA